MKKLGTVIRYECITSFKYIWIFYLAVFAAVSLISALVYVSTGNMEKVGTNCLEMNSIIYVGILGVLGFKEDFKMLIQNGFTRKYIFLGTVSLFAFVSGIMALVDTIAGNVMHTFISNYNSLFGSLYGYEHSVLLNWLWLFLIYMFICSFFYLVILAINKIGKKSSIYAGVFLGATFMAILAAFRFVLPEDFKSKFIEYAIKGIGFMNDGSINFAYPVLLLLLFAGILSYCSYLIIRKTELHA